MIDSSEVTSPSLVIAPPTGWKTKKGFRIAAWTAFALGCLIFFTILKIPETRIKAFIHGTLVSMAGQRGITFSAARTSISFLFGVSYRMSDVTINLPPPSPPVKIDNIEFSPAIFALLSGRMGGTLWLESASAGKLKTSFSYKDSRASPELSLSYDAGAFDMGRMGLLTALAGVQGSVLLNGAGSFSGDPSVPSTWSGRIQLGISKLALDPQSIYGFSVPRISIGSGKIDIAIERGKASIQTLVLGKSGGSDDITANVSGDVLLGKSMDASTLNLKTKFTLSENLLHSFVLIDAILGPGKQSDGSYAYGLSGPLSMPNAVPGGK